MIGVVGYGLGNVQAILNIYQRLKIPATLATSADDINRVERIILPGVGAFDWAMERLSASGMREALERGVLRDGKPMLGICVGMQMLACSSAEGNAQGLGWIDGIVERLPVSAVPGQYSLPHMGWNDVEVRDATGLFSGLESGARFYFLHSYFVRARRDSYVLATTDYGLSFAVSVRKDNVMGVQFHPEKSHKWGIRLLRNFAECA